MRLRPRTLRGRLTLVNVLLLAVGLVVAAGVSLMGLYGFLLGELDGELTDTRDAFASAPVSSQRIGTACRLVDEASETAAGAVVSATTEPLSEVVAVVTSDGRMRPACAEVTSFTPEERAALIAGVDDPDALADADGPVSLRADGAGRYRATAAQLSDGSVLVLATSLAEARSSVRRLLLIEAAAGLTLLVLLTAASLAAARRRLRPLEDMAQVAAAIADGDLSHRIGTARAGSDSTEVNQLRTALNAMLQETERVNGQLRQFVADASHELRTPLASIRGYLQLHERGMLDCEEERRAFERIAAESERMGHLVDELLALARIDRRPAPRPRPVDLARLVADGIADLRAQQPERPVATETDRAVVVRGDEALLRQLVGNLLSNVRVHTPPDSLVTVSAHAAEGEAVLRVADNGPGMAPEDAARVFDRFFRADPDRARATGGSGLGMSIVQAVVEAHDGSVELDTAPGEGLTATARLPLGTGKHGQHASP
ncbi:sensor histidine kinase [Streptomyces sp. 6N223]|uniref:sensor histidine kinase n=1 Tax=Streptomyces sp. 6N223 TaxID=3457412 RepID=UPI003FD007E0